MGCCILSTYNHLPVTGTAFVYHIIAYTGCAVAEYYGIAISESFYALKRDLFYFISTVNTSGGFNKQILDQLAADCFNPLQQPCAKC